ncbi:MAG: SRPBCC domain-containing protein [Rhodobiaceae bacterium]|nr:SRPBCC domain-containing protein [Rhodobiaceae bacterium]
MLVAGWAFAPSQQVTTEVHIDASPEQVWAVLSDFENYGSWNPFLPSIHGPMQIGENLTIQFASQAFGDMEITPTVLVAEANREFRWKGKLFFPGIFDGEHFFQLEAEQGGTRLVHGEDFSGLLLWVVDLDVMKPDFNTMNTSLAAEVSRRG